MLYPTEHRAPDPTNAQPILGTLRQSEEDGDSTQEPYPVPYEISRKY